MIRIVISILVLVKCIQTNILKSRCHGGVLLFNQLHYPCNCTGLSRTGRFCNDALRPGLILVPGGRKPNTALKNERRHAKVIAGKMERILYNRTTDTMIGIFDTLVNSVYFDKATVDEICSIPTDTCNITEEEILDKIRDKIECRLHKDQHTVYGTCSAPNNLIANEEQTFMKRLNKKDTTGYWNLQIWEERCSMLPNTRNYTGKRLIGCTSAVIVKPKSNAPHLVNHPKSSSSQDSPFFTGTFGIGIAVGFGICGVAVTIAVLVLLYYFRWRIKRTAKAPDQSSDQEISLYPTNPPKQNPNVRIRIPVMGF